MSDQTVVKPFSLLEDEDDRRIKCPFKIQFTKEFMAQLEYSASFMYEHQANYLLNRLTESFDELHFSEIEAMANGEEGRLELGWMEDFRLGAMCCYPTVILLFKEDVLNWGAYYAYRLLEHTTGDK